MGGGILQIAANCTSDSIFIDQNYTFFKVVYHKHQPFSIEDYILNLSSLSDFGKKIDVTIPKVGDLLTDMMLVIDLPEVSGEYTFTNRDEYLASLQNQYTFSTMTDLQQYNENLYKLNLGNNLQAYLVRDYQINKYQLILPLLDVSMFLSPGKSQKFSLDTFINNNSQFFDNEYKLHTINDLKYSEKPNISNIDYLNYSFQDKEFYFFIANLLNIKEINPNYVITYYNEWQETYYKTVKKYILRRPEIIALNTFIENMNTQINNSLQINDYVFDYESIFLIDPLDYQYNVILPNGYNTNYYLLYSLYENVSNNKNYLLDYTSSFFNIFNKNYILIKRNNAIIGACIIKDIVDINPLTLVLQPFRHIFTNKLIETYNNSLYMYYGFNNSQFEPINFAQIMNIRLNINNYHEFTLDRSIYININDIILIGINSNSYNQLYGIFKIIEVRKSFMKLDHNSITNYNTELTVQPIEIDQLYLTDTVLMTSYSNIPNITYYQNNDLNNIKNIVYTDITISTINQTYIKSVSEKLLRDFVFAPDFVLTTNEISTLNTTVQTYLYDSYDVLFNYMKNVFYKTIIKTETNQDYLNNFYFKINYQQLTNIFNFIGVGDTTFTNIVNGVFRYQQYLISTINKHILTDDQYTTQLSYTNFLTTYIIDQYKALSDNYNNEWSALLLNIRDTLSDTFIKVINYLQYNNSNTNGRKTLITFITDPITVNQIDITSVQIQYYQKDVTINTISEYILLIKNINTTLIKQVTNNSISFDLTNFILDIQDSFNIENIDFKNSYIIINGINIVNIQNITTYLDNYSTDLINIINDNTNITTQLYGNNILLDYINTQHEVMFGNMKNYELNRQSIIRNGGTKYSIYQEDIIDLSPNTPLLVNNTFIVNYRSEEYFPRFLYSKQTQIYQNIYQKIHELSENYLSEESSIYFVNNINYERTDGYNYTNNAQGSIPYLDPNQLSLILHPTEYSYNLLDRLSINNIIITPSSFSFIRYLEELEQNNNTFLQKSYLQNYWNNVFIQNGITTTTTNNYIASLAGKDDGLLMYYMYKYLSELLAVYGDLYNLNVNLDDTYFKTIYQLSPNILGDVLFQTVSSIISTLVFTGDIYEIYNSIIQNETNLYEIYTSYAQKLEYRNLNNQQFSLQVTNLISELSYLIQVVLRITIKYKINLVLTSTISLSSYPIIYKIHGSNQLIKIILASDQYTITSALNNTNFTSSVVFPTGYHIDQYYKIFNLSIHYDYIKYLFIAGYGGILRDTQYTDKTLANFYKKINNYITPSINSVDFAFFYAFQSGIFLPNMEGNIIQSYQAWIQKSIQPYFYYFNTLSLFYDMMYIYDGRSFISEYYTTNTTNTTYNNRPDTIQGELVYSTRMAYSTRDNKNRLAGIGMRYNLLDQRLYGIMNTFNATNAPIFDYVNDPIQVIQILSNLNTRFTDYQEFLALFKNSMNLTTTNTSNTKYNTITTQFKVNSFIITDLDLFNGWNDYVLNYLTNNNYKFGSVITGLSTAINQYNQLSAKILDLSSIGYELNHFIQNFNNIHQRNFGNSINLRYLNNTNYHQLINEYNAIFNNLTYFSERDTLQSDFKYRDDNYSLISLEFMNITLDKITSIYQSDVAVFKELFKNILNYRQKTIPTSENSTPAQNQLLVDYNSVNDVTSLTFYDKFFKFSENVDYHLIPQIYHDLYNIQNASHTVVFYLNYLFSYLSNTSAKPNIGDYDNPNLSVSYYYIKYLSSGLDYFLSNFHQLKIDNTQFYPYKSIPPIVKLYDGNQMNRPKSFMYLFTFYKIQYRQYMYGSIDNAFIYESIEDYNNKPIRHILQLNTFIGYPEITSDLIKFDTVIDNLAFIGNIDHLQNITHPFFINKHMDNLLFIKDLLNDLSTVSDNATINTILPNNDNYIEFLNEKIIITNSFDENGLIFGGYLYALGMLANDTYMGTLPIFDSSGQQVNTYVEGTVVLPALIYKIYYFLLSECYILNQTELIGSSFQITPISLGNTLGQVLAKDWKNGLINLISEYLYLLLKSKKIIYQNSIYEISYYDLYSRIRLFTNTDRLNDIVDMYLNSLLKVTISTYTLENITQYIYNSEYDQFKIPANFSLLNIKKNFNYSIYYQLIFALRQSLIGKYNNFEERVRFHNAYDYWIVNNNNIISDYTEIEFNEQKYLIKKSDETNVNTGLTYYYNNKTNVPTNLYTTIIDYIIGNITNIIYPSTNTKYAYKNFVFKKNGYDVTLTLYNVYFDNPTHLFDVTINSGSKTVSGIQAASSNVSVTPFSIIYSYMPVGYEYNLLNNTIYYQQLLYQNDITILESMFSVFKNIQDISATLNILSDFSTPTISDYNFMHFSIFVESFIYYNFTSTVDPTKKVITNILPLTANIGISQLFNLTFINWSEFYGQFFYVYVGNNPIQENFLGSSTVIFSNGVYVGSIYITFLTTGKQFISITNQLIDSTHPFGSSDVSINITTPVTITSISDGSLDNNYAIITIPRSIKITLFGWTTRLNINKLYTFVSDTSDDNGLTNTNGGLAGDGPFSIEVYQEPNSNINLYRINAILTFPASGSKFIYVSDKQDQTQFSTATVYSLIPNISHYQTINIVNDIDDIAKIGTINNYSSLLSIPTTYTITLTNWDAKYRINQLYIYFADNTLNTNLGDDKGNIETPLVRASIVYSSTFNTYKITFTAGFRYLGNHYVYLMYNLLSNSSPFGSLPVNFLLSPTNPLPIVTTRIENVTGILNQYIALINTDTTFKVTLGNWLASYITDGINKLYIYTRNITDADVPANYIAINNLSSIQYNIVLEGSNYVVYFTTNFGVISQKYVYLTYNRISSTYPYGTGLVNIQISNPPGSLTQFNYIDVIFPFSTDYVNNQLITFTNNNIQIHVNNYSPNYNIYKTTPNQLFLFLGTTSDPNSIYNSNSPIPIVFDNNNILNYMVNPSSINPVYIFVSENIVYGSGLITYPCGFLVNSIGPVNGILNIPTFIINSKAHTFLITLTNWDASYATIDGITSLYIYLGFTIDNPALILLNTITKPNNYVLNFNTSFATVPNTYNVYISDNIPTSPFNYVRQSLTNQLTVTDQIYIENVTTSITPVPTFTTVTFTGYVRNWIGSLFPTVYVFINKNITGSTPYLQTIVPNAITGQFNFTTQVRNYNYVNIGISDSTRYGSGYLETIVYPVATTIGPINAQLILPNYVINNKSTNYSIKLNNWDATYNISQITVYFGPNINTITYSFGAKNITLVNGIYYLNFTATITNITPGTYNVYISNANFNTQLVANQLKIYPQIALSNTVTTNVPFTTYTSVTFTGTVNNWQSVFPTSLYLIYTELYTNTTTYQAITVNIGITNTITFTKTVNTRPGIKIAISDSTTYGNGYLESNQVTVNNTIGPINANLTTNHYAIFSLLTSYNIELTNWNSSYFDIDGISSLTVRLEKNSTIITYGIKTISITPNYHISFSQSFSSGILSENVYKLRLISGSVISQDVCNFNYGNQISLGTITSNPSPFQTYTDTAFSGTIINWYSDYYSNQLYLTNTRLSNSNINTSLVTINSNGTFTFNTTENTLPGIQISFGDTNVYANSYIKSSQLTISDIIGPVQASIDINRILQNRTKSVIITLTNWNTSYSAITQLYVYIGSDANTSLESYGLQTIIYNSTTHVYSLSFNITPTYAIGTYNLYISDTDPNDIVVPKIRQSLTNQFIIGAQIVISNITTLPTPFATYNTTTFTGTVANWSNTYNSSMYIYITSLYDSTVIRNTVTIDNSNQFIYQRLITTLSGITIALSNSSTYGSGYIESDPYTLNDIIGSVLPSISISTVIPNENISSTVTLNNWNSSYFYGKLNIYIGSLTTQLQSITGTLSGIATISETIDINNNIIYYANLIINPSVSAGNYDIYISDTDPTETQSYDVREKLSTQLSVVNQVSLSISPMTLTTYTDTIITGTITNWISAFYNDIMYYSYNSDYDSNTYTGQITNLNNFTGEFSITINVTPSTNFNIYIYNYDENLPPTNIYPNNYIQSNTVIIPTGDITIGPINATKDISAIIEGILKPITITLTQWDETYYTKSGIQSLYIWIYNNTTNPVLITPTPISLTTSSSGKHDTISTSIRTTVIPGTYTLEISTTEPDGGSPVSSHYIEQYVDGTLTVVGLSSQIYIDSITQITSGAFLTFKDTTFSGVLSNWIPDYYNDPLYIVYYSSYDNVQTISSVLITIVDSTTGSFEFTVNVYSLGNFNIFLSDNDSFPNDGALKSNTYTITNIQIGEIDATINPISYKNNQIKNGTITLTNWNTSFGFTQLYIYWGNSITPVIDYTNPIDTQIVYDDINSIYKIVYPFNFSLTPGTYTLNISDTNPTSLPYEPTINQIITPDIRVTPSTTSQISINVNSDVYPVSTFTDITYTITINNWISDYNTIPMYVIYYSGDDSTLGVAESITIFSSLIDSNTGIASFRYILHELGNFSMYVSDSNSKIFGNGIIESNIYVYSYSRGMVILGSINPTRNIDSVILGNMRSMTIELPHWDATYDTVAGITQLYVIIVQQGGGASESDGPYTIYLDTDDVYKITFDYTLTITEAVYDMYISDKTYQASDPLIYEIFPVGFTIRNQLILNRPLFTDLFSPSPIITYILTTFTYYVSNWLPEDSTQDMVVVYSSSYDNVEHALPITIQTDPLGSDPYKYYFTFEYTVVLVGSINIYIKDSNTLTYLLSNTDSITSTIQIGNITSQLLTPYVVQNTLTSILWKLPNWNASFAVTNIIIHFDNAYFGIGYITGTISQDIDDNYILTGASLNYTNIDSSTCYLTIDNPDFSTTTVTLDGTITIGQGDEIYPVITSSFPIIFNIPTIITGTMNNWHSYYGTQFYIAVGNSDIETFTIFTPITIDSSGNFSFSYIMKLKDDNNTSNYPFTYILFSNRPYLTPERVSGGRYTPYSNLQSKSIYTITSYSNNFANSDTNGYLTLAGGDDLYSYYANSWTYSGKPTWITTVKDMVYNGSLWILMGDTNLAISYNQSILSSLDWIEIPDISSQIIQCNAIGWNGINWVLAVTPQSGSTPLLYSLDGLFWSNVNTGNLNLISRCTSIATNGSLWVASGNGTQNILGFSTRIIQMFYSTDGINWNVNTFSDSNNYLKGVNCNTICWNGNIWLAGVYAGLNNNIIQNAHSGILYSTDGMTWTGYDFLGYSGPTVKVFTDQINKITWNGSLFVAVGNSSDSNNIAYSIDGTSWNYANAPTFSNPGTSVTWDGKTWIASCEGTIVHSSDGINWFNVDYSFGPTEVIQSVVSARILPNIGSNEFTFASGAYSNSGSYNPTYTYSLNTTAWKTIPSLPTLQNVINVDPSGYGFDGVYNISYNQSTWLMTLGSGSTTGVVRSTNGITWSLTNLDMTNIISCNASTWGIDSSGSEIWIVAVTSAVKKTIFYSTDSIQWTEIGFSYLNSALCIAWNGIHTGYSLFIVGGTPGPYGSFLTYSNDGETWNAGYEQDVFIIGGFTIDYSICNAVVYNNIINTWIAVGNVSKTKDGVTTQGCMIISSPDGNYWTDSGSFTTLDNCTGIAYNRTTTVVCGIQSSSTSQIAYAYNNDITTWQPVSISGFDTSGFASSIVWNGTYYIICDAILQQIFISPDGINWTISLNNTNNANYRTIGVQYQSPAPLLAKITPIVYSLNNSTSFTVILYYWRKLTSSNPTTLYLYTTTDLYLGNLIPVTSRGTVDIILFTGPYESLTEDVNGPNAYFTCDITFTTSNTYYFILSDQSDPFSFTLKDTYTEIINPSVPISNILVGFTPYVKTPILNTNSIIPKNNYSNLRTLLQLPTKLQINEHTPFHIKLNNWSNILRELRLNSDQLYNFNISIGTKNTSPVFICKPYVKIINNIYLLTIPPLKNVHNKYLFISITIYDKTIDFDPILINKTVLTLKNKDTNYKLKNKNETYSYSVNSKAVKLYVYADTIPYNKTKSKLELVASEIPIQSNEITFTHNSNKDILYFYVSTGEQFTGATYLLNPIHLVDINTLQVTLDTYDINTSKRNILLENWNIDLPNINIISKNFIKNVNISEFTPLNIDKCNVWLDASDTDNFNLINTNQVSKWIDKTNNKNDATNIQKMYPGYNSINKSIYFDLNTYFNLPDNTIPSNNSDYHIFIVLTPLNTHNMYNFILGSIDNLDKPSNKINTILLNNNQFINSWNQNDISSIEYNINTIQLISFEHITDEERNIYINGIQIANDEPIKVINSTTTKNNLIGGIINKFRYTGGIHEIIIYNDVLTQFDRECIENYLIHKWNIKKN